MNKEKILVTGGAGFIGANLVKKLVEAGYAAVVFDNNYRGSKTRLRGLKNKIEIINGDIREKSALRKAARGCGIIFHLAFINGTRYFYEKPELVLEVGVKGALNTLEVALENKISKFMLMSSSEVYHQPDNIPTTEAERLCIPDISNPRYSYSGAKIISELLTINYLRKTAIKHCIIRPHNVFGPDMGFEHVIPELMQKLYTATGEWRKKRCKLEIQGSAEESRAFCFVNDAIEQIMAIFQKGKNTEVYNIGMDEEQTVRKLITDISRLLDIRVEIVAGELRKGGTLRRCPSIKKVCSLGYIKKNHYFAGLKETVEWYKKYFKEKKGKI